MRLVLPKTRTAVLIALWASAPAARVSAQDAFEIAVYPAATLARGEWELETHLNYTARGTTAFDGTVAPTEKQTHLSFELSHGITFPGGRHRRTS